MVMIRKSNLKKCRDDQRKGEKREKERKRRKRGERARVKRMCVGRPEGPVLS